MKKAIITGITGQEGAYLAEFLLNKGYEVHRIKSVDGVFMPIDKGRTVYESTKQIDAQYNGDYHLFFANGGDQNND